eukprot:GHRQ01002145.1.p3 GENE.GHRQ01002145.1~~GHRQ01002145.1.p3  ORF type:complete len:107 (+),score=33.63 GHRQ01002145.1:58-378(+)
MSLRTFYDLSIFIDRPFENSSCSHQAVASTPSTMDPQRVEQEKQQNAQEMFDKSFDELEPHDRQRVGGKVGGGLRGGQLADPDRAPEPPAVKFGEDNPAPGQSKDA